jgi:hypothetical protein
MYAAPPAAASVSTSDFSLLAWVRERTSAFRTQAATQPYAQSDQHGRPAHHQTARLRNKRFGDCAKGGVAARSQVGREEFAAHPMRRPLNCEGQVSHGSCRYPPLPGRGSSPPPRSRSRFELARRTIFGSLISCPIRSACSKKPMARATWPRFL